jgi:GTPase involved in cell partitioning and DNA repair
LEQFNPAILAKPTLLVGTKRDAMDDAGRLRKLQRLARGKGLELVSISSATGQGLLELKYKVAQLLQQTAITTVATESI